MDGLLRDIRSRARTLAWGRVESVSKTSSGHEIDLTILPTDEQVTAELGVSIAGPSGTLVREPSVGDIAVVGLINGDPNDAIVLTWVHVGAMPGPDVDAGGVYLVAPTGEFVELRTGAGAKLELTAEGRVGLGNDAGELLEQVSKSLQKAESICQNAASAVVATVLGPQPLSTAPLFTKLQLELVAIRTIIDLIRK